jgi:Ca-activated chloride channel homolog
MVFRRAVTSSVGLAVIVAVVFWILASLALAQDVSVRPVAAQTQEKPRPSPGVKPKEEEPQTSDDVVRVETNLTSIFFTAEDKHKRFISTLKQEDIRVLEDGLPQKVFTFQQNTDLPLSIAILVDTSRSEERTLPEEKSAAREFLESVLRANKDEAAIVSFTGEVTLEQGFTGSLERLRRAIDRVEFVPPAGYVGGGVVVQGSPGGTGTPPISGTNQQLAGSTAIWDAVWATSDELLQESAEHTRRAIILLTDGEDTISQVKMSEAVEKAQKADALLYAIGIGDRYSFGINEGALRKITDQTGGRAYFPRNERELKEAFSQIQRDLREQYLLAYSPANKNRDGTYRRIQIEVVNPELVKELRLNYRQGYFAKSPDAVSNPPRKRP